MIVGLGQCPVCLRYFDEKEHLPYDVCKEGHYMCLGCIKNVKKAHKTCTWCKNPLEERQNKFALQLLRVINQQQLTINQLASKQKAQTVAAKTSNSPNEPTDNPMDRTAFFPNPSSFDDSFSEPKVLKPQTQQKAKEQEKSSNYELTLMQQHYRKLVERGIKAKQKCDEVQAYIKKLSTIQPPPPQLQLWQQKLVALHNEFQKVTLQQKELASQCQAKALQQVQALSQNTTSQSIQSMPVLQSTQNMPIVQTSQNIHMSFVGMPQTIKASSESTQSLQAMQSMQAIQPVQPPTPPIESTKV